MSTRSMIGIKNVDGTVDAVYCHHDGYPSYVGDMLYNYYTEDNQVRELIDMGPISSLSTDIENSIFYHRDYDEDYQEPERFNSVESFYGSKNDFIIFHYLFNGKEWEISDGQIDFVLTDDIIENGFPEVSDIEFIQEHN